MLILDLAAVAREPVRVEGEIQPDDPLWEGSDLRFRGPLHVDVEARSVGEGILARGRMEGELDLECRRCLTAVPTAVELPLDLYYEAQGDEDEDWSDEIYPLPTRGDALDLGPAVREELLLQVPKYVICREACRGLCGQCGANLNETTCECVPEAAPSPWDALKKLEFD